MTLAITVLFRIRLEVAAEPGSFVPVHMYLARTPIGYDPRLPAYANNCGVAADVDENRRDYQSPLVCSRT